jgi:preprotein translocase subunit SecF
MTQKFKILVIIIVALALFFIITNPTYKDFKEFSDDYRINYHYEAFTVYHQTVRKKLANHWFYSIYQIQTFEKDERGFEQPTLISSKKYIGILSLFFELKD